MKIILITLYLRAIDQDETRFQELFKEMMGNLDEDIKRGTVQQKDSYGLI